MLVLDDLFDQTPTRKLSIAHTLRIDDDTKRLLVLARSQFGKEVTAEIIRRSIESGLHQALAHPKAKK